MKPISGDFYCRCRLQYRKPWGCEIIEQKKSSREEFWKVDSLAGFFGEQGAGKQKCAMELRAHNSGIQGSKCSLIRGLSLYVILRSPPPELLSWILESEVMLEHTFKSSGALGSQPRKLWALDAPLDQFLSSGCLAYAIQDCLGFVHPRQIAGGSQNQHSNGVIKYLYVDVRALDDIWHCQHDLLGCLNPWWYWTAHWR